MPASRQQPRQLTEHRVTLTINDRIFVVIYSDAVIVIESAAQQSVSKNSRISDFIATDRRHVSRESAENRYAADGLIAAIEIKSAATPRVRDTRWITRLRDKVGTRFVGGLNLHTGPQAQPFGDRLAAIPIDALWSQGGS